MSIIAARIYRDGRLLTELDLAKLIPKLERKEDFVWIGLHDPDAATIKAIQDHFGLHPLAVEDALD
ncbi:MAG: magnesium transporter, partial [Sphingomonadales bacterium]